LEKQKLGLRKNKDKEDLNEINIDEKKEEKEKKSGRACNLWTAAFFAGILLHLAIPTGRGRLFFGDIVRSESLTDRLKTVFILR